MEFKLKRNDSYLRELKETLSSNYSLVINDIKEASRGVDGETWNVYIDNNQKVFVKIGYLKNHIQRMMKSAVAIQYMQEHEVNNINKIIKNNVGNYYTEFNNGIIILFEYIDGQIDFDIPYTRVMENLIKIYKLGDNQIIQREDFEVEKLINNLNEAINSITNNVVNLKKKINFYNLQIQTDINNLLILQRRINKMGNKFITHGDCCVNIIEGSKKDYIIDWDDAMVAPIERDCWFFMNVKSKIDDINKMLVKNRY